MRTRIMPTTFTVEHTAGAEEETTKWMNGIGLNQQQQHWGRLKRYHYDDQGRPDLSRPPHRAHCALGLIPV